MLKFQCLLFLILYQCCYGYPTKGISGELPDGAAEIQNFTDIRVNTNTSTNHQNTTSNTFSSETSPQEFSKLVIKIQHLLGFIIRMEDLMDQSHTTSNSTDGQQAVAKKVITKTKEGFKKVKDKVTGGLKQVKDKVKGGFKEVKDKVKVGIDKIKDKMGKVKDNIGSGGGGSNGGGYGYRDNYHHRPTTKKPMTSGYSGGGTFDPIVLWVILGVGIACVVGTMLYFVIKR